MKDECVLFSMVYWAPIPYLQAWLYFSYFKGYKVAWNLTERYQKQSYRNRAEFVDSQGKQSLVVPVRHEPPGVRQSGEVLIDYSTDWVRNHVGALRSAYGRSAYFAHYFDGVLEVLHREYTYLHELNRATFDFLLWNLLGIACRGDESTWVMHHDTTKAVHRLEDTFNPKRGVEYPSGLKVALPSVEYVQVFMERVEFVEGLSGLDLLFNEGPAGRELLLRKE